jgi:hypothetical protein
MVDETPSLAPRLGKRTSAKTIEKEQLKPVPLSLEEQMYIKQKLAEASAKGRFEGTTEQISKNVVQGVLDGTLPPDPAFFGRGMIRAKVLGDLSAAGYDTKAAIKDWKSVNRLILTLGGPQQTRLRQATDTAFHSLGVIEELNDRLQRQIPRGAIEELNAASLVLAVRGQFGPEASATARQMQEQIAIVAGEIANVVMGGNSPTEKSMELAQQTLSGDWSQSDLRATIATGRLNLRIRRNSIINTVPLVPGKPLPELEAEGGLLEEVDEEVRASEYRQYLGDLGVDL